MTEKTKLPSDTFCALPWMHLSTRPDGNMRVCCTANASSVGATNDKKHGGQVGLLRNDDGVPANLNNADLMSSWNNGYMKNVRKQMLNGEKPPSCLKCFKEEDAGHLSKRQWETDYWLDRFSLDDIIGETAEDGGIPPKIRYIDLRMGSKCNLKCIMCSPHDSSLWVKDWQEVYPKIKNPILKESMSWANKGKVHGANYNWHKDNPKFWDQLYEQIPNMYQLYFAGGESTIIEEHYTLLEEVIKRGYAHKIELRYNSNGVEMPNRLFEIWSKFKRVRFHYSVDSIGKMNDYIRFPADWDHTVKQFHLLDNTDSKVEVTTACAVQALNIYYIPDFIKWKLEQQFKKVNKWPFGAGMINYHFVYWPPQLNVKVLPQWFKNECKRKYEEFYPWLEKNWKLSGAPSKEAFMEADYGIKRLNGMIKFMMSEDWSVRMPEFREYITQFDIQRNTNFKTVFPEMAGLLDETLDNSIESKLGDKVDKKTEKELADGGTI
jgi:hypothetical protein